MKLKTKNTILAAVMCLSFFHASDVFAQRGGVGGGGGTGCKATFMAAAYQTAAWIEKSGYSLKPTVDVKDYVSALNTVKVVEVPKSVDLKEYGTHGKSVTSRYDGNNTIEVRCDRLNAETQQGLKRVTAHEIFRKMKIEGDAYEVSRQIFDPKKPDLSKITSGLYTMVGKNVACDAHVMVNDRGDDEKEVILTFAALIVTHSNVRCPYGGLTITFKYDSAITEQNYSSSALEVFEPLSNGDFILRYLPLQNAPDALTYTKVK